MSEPKRLFDGGTPLEQSILGLGRDESPSDDLESKMLAAIARSRAKSSAPTQSFDRWSRSRTIVLGIAAVGLGVIMVGYVVRRNSAAREGAPSGEHAVAPRSTVPVPRRSVSGADDGSEPVVTLDALPNVASPSVASPGPTRPAPTVSSESTSIAREVELLDDVKAKLGSGDAAGAARGLDAYDREFPKGTLRPEATVLRIRALLAHGELAAAETLGREFLARHPNGVHAKRIRALLAEDRDPSAN